MALNVVVSHIPKVPNTQPRVGGSNGYTSNNSGLFHNPKPVLDNMPIVRQYLSGSGSGQKTLDDVQKVTTALIKKSTTEDDINRLINNLKDQGLPLNNHIYAVAIQKLGDLDGGR
ncbi:MAG: hypothetical protein LW807_04770 [Proteobacteria bacterium]|jgi:hypothetical protein|nr:hypothetical protein [Pseudomonadota bacterium]